VTAVAVPTSRAEPLLVIDGLDVRIGDRHILQQFSFEIRRGEVLGVVGASGSGKSMSASAVVGLAPDSAVVTGSIRFDGTELTALDDDGLCRFRGIRIGFVPQDPMGSLTPTRTVVSQLVEAITIHRPLGRRAARAEAFELLARVGLPGSVVRVDSYPHQLSGGMRQRVAIAIAVANAPQLLIADEPTSALDSATGAGILDLFGELLREREMAMLLISHDPALVERMSDRTITVDSGRVIATSATATSGTATFEPSISAERRISPKSPGTETVLAVRDLTVVHRRSGPHLRRSTDVVACRDVSLSVSAGEAVALVGPSGSGKTTVLSQILSLRAPAMGRIEVFGHDVATLSAADRLGTRTRMQAVFQDPSDSLDPRMTVAAVIAEPLHIHRRAAPASRIRELLELVGMPAQSSDRYPRQLSGGQQQRVAIARALALEPELLVLDEPVSSLDAPLRMAIMELLDDLRARLGVAYLLVSHDLELVERHVDRTITLEHSTKKEEPSS